MVDFECLDRLEICATNRVWCLVYGLCFTMVTLFLNVNEGDAFQFQCQTLFQMRYK